MKTAEDDQREPEVTDGETTQIMTKTKKFILEHLNSEG